MSTPETGDPRSARPERILVVEDNDAACKGLSKFLIAMGYEVQVVIDGASALEALRTGPPPDFVLTDLRLPDFDGREVALSARQLVPPPRVGLITGWDLERDENDRVAWGIDWVFAKPLDVNQLLAKLRERTDSSTQLDPIHPATSYEAGEGMP